MTNAGLLVFTLNAFPVDSLGHKVWAFYIFQLVSSLLVTTTMY